MRFGFPIHPIANGLTFMKAAYRRLKAIKSKSLSDQRICHFSFHKNLTVYYGRVSSDFAEQTGRSVQHFNSFKGQFQSADTVNIRSVNNHCIDIDPILAKDPKSRFSLFVRDPRDLIVSGYHYHKRGAEQWCNVKNPTDQTLETVNLCLPKTYLRAGESIAECFQRLSFDDGIRMEIELRKPHLETLRSWTHILPSRKEILYQRYEDVIQDEVAAFEALAVHYGLTKSETRLWCRLADKHSAKNSASRHIRNPSSGQWADLFPADVTASFSKDYGDILRFFSYEHVRI